MSSRPLHVLIVGGGIGGLCLAQGLKKAGVSVAVYERDRTPDSRVQGYRINISPTGSTALHDCLPQALWEVLVATAGEPGRGIAYSTGAMRELAIVGQDEPPVDPADPATGRHAVSRITLRTLLRAGLDDVVHFDKEFVGYGRTSEGKVIATFADGSTAIGDVLVGADGSRSRVRAQLLPDAERIELPAIGIGGKLMLTDKTTAWLPRRLVTGMNVFWPRRDFLFTAVFRRRQDPAAVVAQVGDKLRQTGIDPEVLLAEGRDSDYILWAYVAHRDTFPASFTSLDGAAIQEHLVGRTPGWHPDLRRLMADSGPANLQSFEFTAAAPVKLWASTNVTVLGDAIHHMPPVGGLGGNAALYDASHLCRSLVSVASGESALIPAIQAYEVTMRKHGFGAVKEAVGYTRGAISRNLVARTFTRAFFRVCGAVPAIRRATLERNEPPPTARTVPGQRPLSGSHPTA
jgi:2-polyprenyl-6-methoxyphenol hydroxylase-like FAD-dependent oxidoreductase